MHNLRCRRNGLEPMATVKPRVGLPQVYDRASERKEVLVDV